MNKALKTAAEKFKTLLIFALLPGAVIQYFQWWNGASQIVETVTERVEQVSTVASWIQK